MPGTEYTVFDVEGNRFSVLICWEAYFPVLVREFVRNGAGFLVQMTNEAWFGDTAAPYQLLASTVFRAVENRVFVARSSNTGVSGFVGPHGDMVDRVENGERDTFVEGYATYTLGPRQFETIYTRYGDIFALANLVCVVVILIIYIVRKPRYRHVGEA